MEMQAYSFKMLEKEKTYAFAAGTTVTAGNGITLGADRQGASLGNLASYRIVNASTGQLTFYLGPSKGDGDAVANPVAGTPQANTYVMLPSTVETFLAPYGAYFQGFSTVAGNAYITPGEGL